MRTHSILIVGVISIITFLLRALPFMIFNGRETPKYLVYIGKVLPYSIIGMLLVYCLKGVSVTNTPYGLPELITCVLIVILHIKFRNVLVSIGLGTGIYMMLVQLVFV